MSRIAALCPNRPRWILLLLLGLTAFVLSPTFRMGYYSDDSTNSLLPGVLKAEGYSLPEYIAATTRLSVQSGRFYPLQLVQSNSWFALVRDPSGHKAMVAALVGLDLVLFYLLVRRVARDAGFAAFATAMVIPLFQFRIAFDPILAFFGLFQFIAAGVLGSLLALQVYLDTNRARWLALASALYLATILMYELSDPLFLIHLVLVGYGRRGWRARALAALPFALVGGAGFLTSAGLRWYFVSRNEFLLGLSQVNLDPFVFLLTLARQTSAAFPLSYYLVNDAGLYPRLWDLGAVVKFLATAGAVTAVAGTLATCLASLRHLPAGDDGRPGVRLAPAALVGVLLGVLPAVLVSLSVRHQGVIKLGVGYTPVYLQYFGVGLLLATGAWGLLSALPPRGPLRRWATVTTALLVAAVAGLTYRANAVLVARLETPLWAPGYNRVVGNALAFNNFQRKNLESALRAGLVENVPEHSLVVLTGEYPGWYDHSHSRYFFAMYGAKVLATFPLTSRWGPGGGWFLAKHASRPLAHPPGTAPFLVRDVCIGPSVGYVVLSQGGADGAGEIRVFVRHPGLFRPGPTPSLLLTGEAPTSGTKEGQGRSRRRIVRGGGELTLVRSGRDWGLFSLSARDVRPTPESITVAIGPVAPSKRNAASGFRNAPDLIRR